ncbi:hypothetical protein [Streptomyces sp. IBSBF 2950]|uniref:hypothetical protein n=1 Tax=Streptomyces sp. IBSBF 2950 TaxID=2903528 RepID=UPI002FDC5A26
MGAVLHLAPAQDVPQDPKWKTGGGGGDGRSLAEFATRIYADKRADPKSRELLLAFAFVITMQPTDDPKEQWHNLRVALCATGSRSQYTDRLRDLIQHDAPRYIPPDYRPGSYDPSTRRCQGPRLRPFRERPWNAEQMTLPQRVAQDKRDEEDVRNRENICGAPGKHRVLEKLPGTGWYQYHLL